jgi:formate hydrogenlyase subunit 6/NADH:ubiquinone oxidoreductase subunit I
MTEDLYFKLGERLNENPIKWPLDDVFLGILREYYTEKEAALGANFPLGSHPIGALAKQLDRDEEALLGLLNAMADNGQVFTAKGKDGGVEYSLTPFFPGVFEFQLMRGNDTPEDRRRAKMVKEFMENMKAMASAMMENPELMKEMMPDAAARTITVEKELPPASEIYPFEKLTELIDQAESFAASVCYCRHHAFLIDNECKVENVPRYSCLSFSNVADFVIERKFGKRISREECYEILESAEKAGLVHNTNNFTGDLIFVCNCCGCCCEFLKMIKELGMVGGLAYSNFELAIDEGSCTGCGDCEERCAMEALSLVGEVISVNKAHCIGCGNCVSVCPTEALSMVRRASVVPPQGGMTMGGLAV